MKKIIAILLMFVLCFGFTACTELELIAELSDIVYEEYGDKIKPSESEFSKEDLKNYPLRVYFLDVGQGDSSFIELPDGKTMLIDAGDPDASDAISGFIDSLDKNKIDIVVATHPHLDHIGSMAKVLKKYEIGKMYMPKKEAESRGFENMLDVISKKEIPLYQAKKGTVIEENSDYKIHILSPEDKNYDNLNNVSAVVKITYGETEYLFMGDAERKVETPLKKLNIEADVLKLGHHGSSTSSGYEFLSMVSPKYAVISCGKDNSYGHPHEEVVDRLNRLNIKYYRTDLSGTVAICADNSENFVVLKEKK